MPQGSVGRGGGRAPLILNLSTKGWVVSFITRGNSTLYPLKREMGGSQS